MNEDDQTSEISRFPKGAAAISVQPDRIDIITAAPNQNGVTIEKVEINDLELTGKGRRINDMREMIVPVLQQAVKRFRLARKPIVALQENLVNQIVLIRPQIPDHSIGEVLLREGRNQSALPPEEIMVEVGVLGAVEDDKRRTGYLVAITSLTAVFDFIGLLDSASMDPQILTTPHLALIQLLRKNEKVASKDHTVAVISSQSTGTAIDIFYRGHLVHSRGIRPPKTGDIDAHLAKQMQRSFKLHAKTFHGDQVDRLFIVDELPKYSYLLEHFKMSDGLEGEPLGTPELLGYDIMPPEGIPNDRFWPLMWVLDQAGKPQDSQPLDLRPPEIQLKAKHKRVWSYVLVAALLGLAISFGIILHHGNRANSLETELVGLQMMFSQGDTIESSYQEIAQKQNEYQQNLSLVRQLVRERPPFEQVIYHFAQNLPPNVCLDSIHVSDETGKWEADVVCLIVGPTEEQIDNEIEQLMKTFKSHPVLGTYTMKEDLSEQPVDLRGMRCKAFYLKAKLASGDVDREKSW